MMAPSEVLSLIQVLDKMFDLGGKLIQMACQCEPRLRTEPLPDEGASMDEARTEALERTEDSE